MNLDPRNVKVASEDPYKTKKMKIDQSYGIIPLRFLDGEPQVLLVKHVSGYWAFPKGHAKPLETPYQAAERELQEETGLRVKYYLSQDVLCEKYSFRWQEEDVFKTVHYFLAEVAGDVVLQEIEIQASQWLSLQSAYECMTFPEGKQLCQEITGYIFKQVR